MSSADGNQPEYPTKKFSQIIQPKPPTRLTDEGIQREWRGPCVGGYRLENKRSISVNLFCSERSFLNKFYRVLFDKVLKYRILVCHFLERLNYSKSNNRFTS